ncbi:hypothetical protein HEFE104084_08045 [Helicobacter felis]
MNDLKPKNPSKTQDNTIQGMFCCFLGFNLELIELL